MKKSFPVDELSRYFMRNNGGGELTSENIKDFHFSALGMSLCLFCLLQNYNYLCFDCDEISHINETNLWKVSVSYIISMFVSFYQGCTKTFRTALEYTSLNC
jgi:hypothetical protein